jgi:nanoRNase/pAp phosphatase (c-di-AMP/oligoRNAs hydrolase)
LLGEKTLVLEKWTKSLSKKSKVLILAHAGADVDAVSSAIALSESLPFSCVIGYPEHLNRSAAALLSNLKRKAVKDPQLARFDALILVDFHDAAHAGRLADEVLRFAGPVWVFDHHPADRFALKTRFSRIDPTAVSCSLLVREELQQAKLNPSKTALRAVAAGILSDSANLLMADYRALVAFTECLAQTDSEPDDIAALFEVRVPVSERIAKLRSASRMRLFELNDFLVAASDVNYFESGAADALVAMGADVALVAGIDHHSGVLRLNARSSKSFFSVSRIAMGAVCRALVPIFGGNGNGHACAAGFSAVHSEPRVVLDAALEELSEALEKKQKKRELREII